MASKRCNPDIVKYLVENGAEVNAKDEVRIDTYKIVNIFNIRC